MNFIKENKYIVIGVLLVVIGFVLYTFLTEDTGTDDDLLITDSQPATTGVLTRAVGAELVPLLNKLPKIEFDEEFLNTQAFRGLVDFGQDLPDQPVGRPNPFAPIGIGSDSDTTTIDDGNGDELVEPILGDDGGDITPP